MSNFAQNIKAWAAKVKTGEDKVIRASLLNVSSRIIKRTAVGNPELWIYNRGTKEVPDYVDYIAYQGRPEGYVGGQARGNWVATINSIDETWDKGLIDKNGGATIKKLSGAIAQATGNVYYLTNSVPYIMPLEYQGHSTQSPDGMVRVSVLEFKVALRKAINEL